MLSEGLGSAENIEQRYYAKDAEAAGLIASIIERELAGMFPLYFEEKSEPKGIAAINTPYDAHIGIIPIIRNGELADALCEGDANNSLVALFGDPLDDIDGKEISVRISATGIEPLTIWIPKSQVKQVDNYAEDLTVTIGRWIQTSLKRVKKLFGVNEN